MNAQDETSRPGAASADDGDDDCPALVDSAAVGELAQVRGSGDAESGDSAAAPAALAVPLVILAGFLGSGKTTLLQFALAADHGLRLAVIVNEFEFGRSIEKGLTVRSAAAADDEWVELRNGCLCCSAKSQSVQALEALVARRRGALDAILVEAAGLADPVPIARSFWLDAALQARVRLAGIVVVADAQRIAEYLSPAAIAAAAAVARTDVVVAPDEAPSVPFDPAAVKFVEAARQLLAADRIVLNKIDAVGCSEFQFLDDQVSVDHIVGGLVTSSSGDVDAHAGLRLAARAIRRVNPVAPMVLCSLRALLGSGDDGPPVPPASTSLPPRAVSVQALRRLLMLDGDSAAATAAGADASAWLRHASTHSHTAGLCAVEIEVAGRAFAAARDVDFLFAALLDNAAEGQDEHDEAAPAQLAAGSRGAVIVRSKAALWVREANGAGAGGGALEAVQVQSIGATFEVAAMAGLNAVRRRRGRGESDDGILPEGVNRLLLLGFNIDADAVRRAVVDRTVPL
jgi:G3E family GTPase